MTGKLPPPSRRVFTELGSALAARQLGWLGRERPQEGSGLAFPILSGRLVRNQPDMPNLLPWFDHDSVEPFIYRHAQVYVTL